LPASGRRDPAVDRRHAAKLNGVAGFRLYPDGAGGSLCSSTAQSCAFLNIANGDMPDASALWNINRQLSFLAGAALLSALLAVLQVYYPSTQAWHGVFIIAACLTLIPLLGCLRLNNQAIVTRLHQKMETP
jgi:predicted Na+-dependent transporter